MILESMLFATSFTQQIYQQHNLNQKHFRFSNIEQIHWIQVVSRIFLRYSPTWTVSHDVSGNRHKALNYLASMIGKMSNFYPKVSCGTGCIK